MQGMMRWQKACEGDYRCDVMYEGVVDSGKVKQLDF